MIIPSGTVRVLVATRPVDFRKGIDGLCALVQEALRSDPYSGVIYVFRSNARIVSNFCCGTAAGWCWYPSGLNKARFGGLQSTTA